MNILQNRLNRLLISVLLIILFGGALVLMTPQGADAESNRLLVMLGGKLWMGLIQLITFWLFFFGMIEIYAINVQLSKENDAFLLHLLPEKENWVMSADDINQLKINVQQIERTQKFYLTDLIKKCCTKYRLSKSSSEVLELTSAQIQLYNDGVESEQSFIRYVAWAIPSVGFIGTVIGISASLGLAGGATSPEGIKKVTSALMVAFDTTLVALVLSIFLMYCIHHLQKKQDALFIRINDYLIENLINRFYK